MEPKISRLKMSLLLLSGMLGCLLMGGSDWLMIYGDTSASGNLAWLTAGVAQIPPWRNALAMGLALPAVLFYSIALIGIRHFLRSDSSIRRYTGLTVLGLTPWLCLHLLYTMILYLFAYLCGIGNEALAHQACEALFSHFVWLVPASEVIMLLPFLYWFFAVLLQGSFFPRWMALNNPLILYLLLKAATLLMPDAPFRLAFTNGLMSEAMLLWFLFLLLAAPRAMQSRKGF